MQIGDMNLVNAIVNLEVQVATQGKLIEKLLADKGSYFVSQADIDKIIKASQNEIAKKYPELGIKFS